MSQAAQISIVGAGTSGLVFGQCLKKRGINVVLYERDSAGAFAKRYNYGSTLRPWGYRPLLKVLQLDESAFRTRLAVDSPVGGEGQIASKANAVSERSEDGSFRVNRNKFEQWMADGLDVRWEHHLESVKTNTAVNSDITLTFRNGEEAKATILVAGDGAHSQVRKAMSPDTDFNILPYAVYNGKRRVDASTFDKAYAPYMNGANVIEHKLGSTLLQITVSERTHDKVSISYTYSRPAKRPGPDTIFQPDRPQAGARDIPDAFFDEISGLSGLDGPFKEVFDVASMRGDRMLNWLMRSTIVPEADLRKAAEQGIVLLGDAVHHGPILGADGANQAIKDAFELAEVIAEKDGGGLGEFVTAKHGEWETFVEQSEQQIAEMHGQSRANL